MDHTLRFAANVYLLLQGNANKKASDDFLSEAAYMGQFDDPNVIALEGVVVRGNCFDVLISAQCGS